MTKRKGELLDILRRQESLRRAGAEPPRVQDPVDPLAPDSLPLDLHHDGPLDDVPIVRVMHRQPANSPDGASEPVEAALDDEFDLSEFDDLDDFDLGAAGGRMQGLKNRGAELMRAGATWGRAKTGRVRMALAGRRLGGLPWVPIGLVLLLAVPFIFWLSGQFGAGTAGNGEGVEAAERNGGAVRGGSGHYAVLAITYPERKSDLARQTGQRLLREGFTDVKLLRVWDEPEAGAAPDAAVAGWLELYVGDSPDKGDPGLVTLLGRIQALDLPTQPKGSEPPFATAYIKEKPREQATE